MSPQNKKRKKTGLAVHRRELEGLDDWISVARGERPADLIIKGANLVNVFSDEIYPADIAIYKGRILGLAAHEGRAVYHADGLYAAPGFIDAHIHLESTCMTIPEFVRATLPMGTTSVIADPHEIANVLGKKGIEYMLSSSAGLPMNIFFMLPSCVPATQLETSGARFEANDLKPFLRKPNILGLAEMMNYPGVLARDPGVLAKLVMAQGRIIDGHAPGMSGRDLEAYIGCHIQSDHECTRLSEALEKVRLGMSILIREGSVARNLEALLPSVTPANARRFAFVTDDRFPTDLLQEGHLNGILKQAVSRGLSPLTAIQMATLNPATFYSLAGLGAIAPGFRADLVLLEDLEDFGVRAVFKDGRLAAEKGEPTLDFPPPPPPPAHTIRIDWHSFPGFGIQNPSSESTRARVIELIPDEILTKETVMDLTLREGRVAADPTHDLAKLAVVERHHATGRVGLGFLKGLGMRHGCIASSVAHDSHNIVVAGMDDEDMLTATRAIEQMGGGLVAVRRGTVIARVPLPVAGLLSDLPLQPLGRQMSDTLNAARSLGCQLPNPFMTLSFLALPVIPDLKLTDRGLVNVSQSTIVPLFLHEG